MLLRQLFDPESSTYTYLLADMETREAVLIDPVRDQLERDAKLIAELGLTLLYTLETHVHADHITSSGALRTRLGSRSVLSHHSGSGCADLLVKEGESIVFGKQSLRILETPGHTHTCITYYHEQSGTAFTGDALLVRGCGRTDFQQGSASQLYASVTEKLFALPSAVLVYPGHDYKGHTVSTIGEEKAFNPRLAKTTEAEFVSLMDRLNLAAPKRIAEAVPANLACGVSSESMAAGPKSELAWAPIERIGDGAPELTVEWLHEHTAEVRIIDVRDSAEFVGELGHIAGSELAPLVELSKLMSQWEKEQPTVVVCRSGRRSASATLELERAGFKRVASLRGGMTDWQKAGYESQRENAQAAVQ